LFMLALLAGAGTSMGLAIPMVSDCLALLFDIDRSKMLDMGVVLICVALFAFSVYWGLEKGIRKLADLNIILAILFLIIVLCIGPTIFILRLGTESIGFMFANFISMLTYTESLERSPFVKDWTIFYWAWWFAYAPFIGLFIARISRGRTLRQVILSMCFFGSLGSWLFFLIIGNYALHLDLKMILDVTTMVQTNPSRAVAEIIATLPLRHFMLGIFILLSIIFIATTYDSASYSLASAASRKLAIGSHPARWHRMFWAFVLGFLPLALLSVSGGIKTAKSLVLVASLPILIISAIMCFSLLKSLRQSHAQ
ncbi:MAG: BCCT family transporter, partial [Alphaproteobacteria bacterium]|nr:BCCT family transporter [Alphaproteobacteria bacterium]